MLFWQYFIIALAFYVAKFVKEANKGLEQSNYGQVSALNDINVSNDPSTVCVSENVEFMLSYISDPAVNIETFDFNENLICFYNSYGPDPSIDLVMYGVSKLELGIDKEMFYRLSERYHDLLDVVLRLTEADRYSTRAHYLRIKAGHVALWIKTQQNAEEVISEWAAEFKSQDEVQIIRKCLMEVFANNPANRKILSIIEKYLPLK